MRQSKPSVKSKTTGNKFKIVHQRKSMKLTKQFIYYRITDLR